MIFLSHPESRPWVDLLLNISPPIDNFNLCVLIRLPLIKTSCFFKTFTLGPDTIKHGNKKYNHYYQNSCFIYYTLITFVTHKRQTDRAKTAGNIYLVSLCKVCFLHQRQCFLSCRRSLITFLFLVEK